MNDRENPAHGGRVRQPVPTSGVLLTFDVDKEVRRLQSEQPWQAEQLVRRSDLTSVTALPNVWDAGGRERCVLL